MDESLDERVELIENEIKDMVDTSKVGKEIVINVEKTFIDEEPDRKSVV